MKKEKLLYILCFFFFLNFLPLTKLNYNKIILTNYVITFVNIKGSEFFFFF